MLTNNSTIFREINELRLQLSGLDSNSKSEKLAKYIQVFKQSSLLKKSFLLNDYSLKLDDVTHIVKLALELNEFEIVHEYCNKIYEDDEIDKLSFYKFQGQAYEAQEDFQSAFATFNKASKIYDNDEVFNSLGRVLKKIESKFESADRVFYQLCIQGGAVINAQGKMNDYVEARIRLNKKYKLQESKPTSLNSYESPSSSSQPLRKYRSDQIQSVKSSSRELFTTPALSTPQRLPTTPESSAPVVEGDFIFPDFPAQPKQQIPNLHQAFDESGGVGLSKAILESIVSETVKNQLAITKKEDEISYMESVKKMIQECEERLKTANAQDRRKIEKDLISLRAEYSNLEQRQIKAEARQDDVMIRQDKIEQEQGKIKIGQDEIKQELSEMKIRIKILEDRIGGIGRIMEIDEIMKIFKSQIQQSKEDNSASSSDLIQIHDQLATRNQSRDQFYQDKIDEIKKNELYSNYYCSLVSELNSLYLVAMAVKNDLIKTTESEKYQKIAAYSKVMYNFIPIVGPLVEGFVDVIAMTRDKCKDFFSKEKMQRFAQLAEGITEFEQISLRLAINLMDYEEITKRTNQAKCLLDGATLRDAVLSRVDEQTILLQNEDDEEIFKCQNNCFELAKNIYFGKSERIATVIGRQDAVKVIELLQEKEFVENIIEESRIKKSDGDIRRTKSIIADSIIEEFNKKKNLKSQANANEYRDMDSEKSSLPNSTISNQDKVNCLTGLKKSIMKCAGY